MKNRLLKPMPFPLIVVAASIAWNCGDSNKAHMSPAQQQANAATTAEDNNQMIAGTQEMMDASAGAFAEKGVTSGRTISEGRLDTYGCLPSVSGNFNLNTSIPDSLIYSGSFTIDYGDGTSCASGEHHRSGKITDTFFYAIGTKGGKFTFASNESLVFSGFHRDSTQYDGTVTIKSATSAPTTVEAKEAKITYKDGTSASWNGMLSFQYQKLDKWRDWGGSTITVTGSLQGTNRKGIGFSADITKGIVFSNACGGKHQFIPISGVVEVMSGGNASTLDYGDGTCDKTYTVTSGSQTTVKTWTQTSL